MALPQVGTSDRADEAQTAPPLVPIETPARRPAPVTILAFIQLVIAVGYGVLTVALIRDPSGALEAISGSTRLGHGPIAQLPTPLLVGIAAGLCIASLAGAILLFRVRRLGWTITMLLAGLSLAVSIYVWWTQSATSSFTLLVEVIVVFYLNQRPVKETFGIIRRPPDESLRATGG